MNTQIHPCSQCQQTMDYIIPIDKGTIDITRAIANAIKNKKENIIHPRNEMEIASREVTSYEDMISQGKMTSSMVTNLSRPRFHGLIAKVRSQSGAYCLTRKGAAFLRGEAIPKFAIISKVTKHQIGYLDPDFNQVTVKDILGVELPYWELDLDYEAELED